MKRICETDIINIPEKYKKASDKKITKKLRKMPPPVYEKTELVIQTPRGKVII